MRLPIRRSTHSTNISMVVLPSSPRRASLRSFWITLCLLGSVGLGTMAWANARLLFSSMSMMVVLLLLGLAMPELLRGPYRAWNRFGCFYGNMAEHLLLRICYWTVIVPVGWTETSLRLKRPEPGESLWVPAQSLPPSLYRQLYSSPGPAANGRSWISSYIAWAWSSNQRWLLALLPFLYMLAELKEEEEAVVRESIYTLF